MNSHSNRLWLLLLLLITLLAGLGFFLKRALITPKVAATFLSYTNGGTRRFVVISFRNREQFPIHWHDVWVEEAGSLGRHAPIMNPSLPWITKPSLESGESETLAVGAPTDPLRWRVCWEYSLTGKTNNYIATSQWFEP